LIEPNPEESKEYEDGVQLADKTYATDTSLSVSATERCYQSFPNILHSINLFLRKARIFSWSSASTGAFVTATF
jgi:hypothetical protein